MSLTIRLLVHLYPLSINDSIIIKSLHFCHVLRFECARACTLIPRRAKRCEAHRSNPVCFFVLSPSPPSRRCQTSKPKAALPSYVSRFLCLPAYNPCKYLPSSTMHFRACLATSRERENSIVLSTLERRRGRGGVISSTYIY